MWTPDDHRSDSERAKWDYYPFESVGPIRFGMTHDQVTEVLSVEMAFLSFRAHTPDFSYYEASYALFPEPCVTTYYSDTETVVFVAIDAVDGPQVTMEGIPLVGQPPSQVAARFSELADARGAEAFTSQQGDPGADDLGLVLRAQRCGDVLLSRPVFAARDWSRHIADMSEGAVPEIEWMHR